MDWTAVKPEQVIAFDCETHLIQPGLETPPLVCASFAGVEGATILEARDARAVFRRIIRSDLIWVNANNAYDACVMLADAVEVGDYDQLVVDLFAKYERGEVWDVLIAEPLDAIALGHFGKDPRTGQKNRSPSTGKDMGDHYSLELVTWLVLGRRDAKRNDYWRMRYAVLERVPMAEWPPDALQYPVDDVVNAREVGLAQMGCLPRWDATTRLIENASGLSREAWADFSLQLSACWGIRSDGPAVDALAAAADRAHEKYVAKFRDLGFISLGEHAEKCANAACKGCKKDGPEVKRRVAVAYGVPAESKCPSCGGRGRRMNRKGNNEVWCTSRSFPGEIHCDGTGLELALGPACPRTPVTEQGGGGSVKADRDALAESGDDELFAFGLNQPEKTRGTYVPWLRQGVNGPRCLSPNILVSSFRTSYAGPIQQFPTSGLERACVISRRRDS